jgi:hypothetical protein
MKRTLVVVRGQGMAWALDADSVTSITRVAAWQGPAPLDPPLGDEPAAVIQSVLLVHTPAGDVAVRACGSIAVETIEAAQVHALPDVLRGGALDSLVVRDGAPPVVLLDPARIGRAA